MQILESELESLIYGVQRGQSGAGRGAVAPRRRGPRARKKEAGGEAENDRINHLINHQPLCQIKKIFNQLIYIERQPSHPLTRPSATSSTTTRPSHQAYAHFLPQSIVMIFDHRNLVWLSKPLPKSRCDISVGPSRPARQCSLADLWGGRKARPNLVRSARSQPAYESVSDRRFGTARRERRSAELIVKLAASLPARAREFLCVAGRSAHSSLPAFERTNEPAGDQS